MLPVVSVQTNKPQHIAGAARFRGLIIFGAVVILRSGSALHTSQTWLDGSAIPQRGRNAARSIPFQSQNFADSSINSRIVQT